MLSKEGSNTHPRRKTAIQPSTCHNEVRLGSKVKNSQARTGHQRGMEFTLRPPGYFVDFLNFASDFAPDQVAARIGEGLRREIGRGRRPRVGDG